MSFFFARLERFVRADSDVAIVSVIDNNFKIMLPNHMYANYIVWTSRTRRLKYQIKLTSPPKMDLSCLPRDEGEGGMKA